MSVCNLLKTISYHQAASEHNDREQENERERERFIMIFTIHELVKNSFSKTVVMTRQAQMRSSKIGYSWIELEYSTSTNFIKKFVAVFFLILYKIQHILYTHISTHIYAHTYACIQIIHTHTVFCLIHSNCV